MKRFFLFALALAPFWGQAAHLVGGEISYRKTGGNATTGWVYQVKLTLYRDCNSTGAPFDMQAPISVYGGANQNTLVSTNSVNRGSIINIPAVVANPCLQTPPNVCTEKTTYTTSFTLLPSTHGYTITYQRCCRNNTISNVTNSGSWGSTYTITIPPGDSIGNSSAAFKSDPPIVLCTNDSLNMDFSVNEWDGDSVYYTFCNPLHGGSQQNPAPNPPLAPNYASVPFSGAFSASYPLPSNPALNLDPVTGILRGKPNAMGQFVFAICAEEYDSNGVLLSTLRRDYQFNVTTCQSNVVADPVAQVDLPNTFCNGTTVTLSESSTNATHYLWLFNDPGNPGASSTSQMPTYTYTDTGTYTIQLVINAGWPCTDTAEVVYELYNPVNAGFSFAGSQCFDDNLIYFQNQSSNGGSATFEWDFGPNASIASSTLTTPPAITFSTYGDQIITLDVEEKGCTDTFVDTVRIYRNPTTDFSVENQVGCAPYELLFNDTTVCDGDAIFNWTFGDGGMSNDSSPTYTYVDPGVYDVTLTVYFTEGCTDTITVHRPNYITVYPSPTAAISITPKTTTIYTSNVEFTDLASDPSDQQHTHVGDGLIYYNLLNFVHNYTDTGWFEVSHVVINTYGCTDTIKDSVRINPETLVFVPNAFSPDGDGTNDEFFFTAVGIEELWFEIYDRWGNVVFSTQDPKERWDGTNGNGGQYPAGTYTWSLLARDQNTNLVQKQGTLTLLR